AAVVERGRPRVLSSGLGYSTIPSIVTFDEQGQPVVGQPAMRQMALRPEETVYGSKRLLGRAYLSGVKKRFQPHFAYELVGEDGWVAAKVCDRVVSLTEVASLILREVRKSAETAIDDRVDRAVVTVPAYFNDAQRSCVREAGELAELNVIRTLNEPTAAALAFGTRQTERKKVVVFDLGGGTFDVSIVDIDADMYEVLGVDGCTFLGGIDFDRACMNLVTDRLSEKAGKELLLAQISRERLRTAVEESKQLLSTQPNSVVQLPHLELADGSTLDVDESITRPELEDAVRPLVDRTLEIVQRALETIDLAPQDIDDVLLVGGQTRMPMVHRQLRSLFGQEPSKRVHPDEVVAIGAAIAAVSLERADAPVLLDVVPLSIGLEQPDGKFEVVVPRNTQVPHR
ncbi:MAG: Hsp70 family protein, partial [Deltaproteobacteria bacterium]|nr:Hsp70 family protein [Deltaproteobacteria bacterium]